MSYFQFIVGFRLKYNLLLFEFVYFYTCLYLKKIVDYFWYDFTFLIINKINQLLAILKLLNL